MLTAAIVLYHNDKEILDRAIASFLAVPVKKKLYLIDNSDNDEFGDFYTADEIEYIYTSKNLGFGKAHNLILKELKKASEYHVILNPDAYFEPDVIPLLLKKLEVGKNIGIIAPKILYPDGHFQMSIRRFPKPYDFFLRRIPFAKKIFKRAFRKVNYLDGEIDSPIEVDAVSGCFQVFRTSVFTKIGGFDERYFMYMEDLDICKKVHQIGCRVLYYPQAIVYHHSEYGSKKSLKLLRMHIVSILKYFLKWNS